MKNFFSKTSLNGDSMMEKQNVKNHIDNYMHEFRQAIYHPILNRDIGQEKLDETMVFFLLLPKLNGETWTKDINTAAIAVGAVYAAFEAHDRIDMRDATSTEQQLTVLSGDYLSGIYYKLLAAIPDFEFIQVLSTTIGQINEVKTEFHHNLSSDPKKNLDALKSIKANCVIQFLYTFGFSKYVPLVAAALPLLALDPVEEDDLVKVNSWTLPSYEVDQAIEALRMEMNHAIAEMDFIDPFLKGEISEMTTPLLRKMI